MKKLILLLSLVIGAFFCLPTAAQERSIGVVNATLTGVLTVTGFGTHAFSAGGTGANEVKVENTTSGTGNSAYFGAYNNAGLTGYLQVFSSAFTTSGINVANGALLGAGRAGGLNLAATDAAGAIRFYTGGTTQRFGINADGDWLRGSTISYSAGTPTISSGFGTGSPSIAGTDSAFEITLGTGASTTGVVQFGHAFAADPICVAMGQTSGGLGDITFTAGGVGTTKGLTYSSASSTKIHVLCFGR